MICWIPTENRSKYKFCFGKKYSMRMKLLQDRVYISSAAYGLLSVLNCGYRTAVNTAAAFITPALFPIWTAADNSDCIRRADISTFSAGDAAAGDVKLLCAHTGMVGCQHCFCSGGISGNPVSVMPVDCCFDFCQFLRSRFHLFFQFGRRIDVIVYQSTVRNDQCVNSLKIQPALSQFAFQERTCGTYACSAWNDSIYNGNVKKVGDDVLLKLARFFGVSTDFLLGITH